MILDLWSLDSRREMGHPDYGYCIFVRVYVVSESFALDSLVE